ncbi:phosphomannomutase/phosphoglucomutase [Deefgea chitinilytica]|uniref:Phosphomannomutase/phosphoglucomutase n=2 Tax=Chitinibacteraceae TaxID=2897177 RepID=A0ABS2CFE6_9NEIS|nr:MULTISPECIES: phosphomannomutase/phosphoglucomutase [Deefgea]MBM5572870.1 phosphomannomutase/phosphoglucomutase [Deefgea chitinilytica]MBM9890107.1 phosphomannomutase/phosphoglucomutase [Deefgea sp. CFH1-16]
MISVPASLFKAYDIRGKIDLLTPEFAYWVGRACGAEAIARDQAVVALGFDGRLSSPAIAAALSRGLCEAGVQVFDLGLSCTPLLYYAALKKASGSGMMITGSHNPPDYNGIKIMLGGQTIAGETLQALRQRIEQGQLPIQTGGVVQRFDVMQEYVAVLKQQLPLKRPLKIVLDCGNGSPGALAPTLYRELGCEVIELYCEVDGLFPNHHPDPQVAENLLELQTTVLAQHADVGLAFDGDGDRLGVVTRSGQIIPGDRLLMLFATAELSQQSGHVLYDVKSSRAVSQWVSTLGGTSEAIPTGHSHMKRRLRETGALIAGELSGHFAFANWGVDDALYAGAKLLQQVAAGVDLDIELKHFPISYSSPELQIPLTESGHGLVAQIAAHAQFPSSQQISAIDGLRIEYTDGFGLIRASNTTPVLTLRIEADTIPAMQRIQQEIATAIAPLPFPHIDEK